MLNGSSAKRLTNLLEKYATATSYSCTGEYRERQKRIHFQIRFLREQVFLINWSKPSLLDSQVSPELVYSIRFDSHGKRYFDLVEGSVCSASDQVFCTLVTDFLQLVANTLLGLLSGKRELSIFDDSELLEHPSSFVPKDTAIDAIYQDSTGKFVLTFKAEDLLLDKLSYQTVFTEQMALRSAEEASKLGVPVPISVSGSVIEEVAFFHTECFDIQVPSEWLDSLGMLV